jgi:hypothetical protein
MGSTIKIFGFLSKQQPVALPPPTSFVGICPCQPSRSQFALCEKHPTVPLAGRHEVSFSFSLDVE